MLAEMVVEKGGELYRVRDPEAKLMLAGHAPSVIPLPHERPSRMPQHCRGELREAR